MHPIVVFIYLLLLLVSNALCYKSNTAIIQATPSDRDENAAGNIPIAELTLNDIAKILERSGETTHPQGFVGQQSRIIDDGPPSSNVRNFVVPRWIKLSNQPQRNKRSLRPLSSSSPLGGGLLADELRAYIASATNELGGSNELVLSDELMNAPLSQLNGDLPEHSSLMKLIRKCEQV